MIPASFYGDGTTSSIPVDPQRLRDARGYSQAGLGALGATIGDTLPTVGYAAAALAGAGLGGALIGYVAADTPAGAKLGAAFAAGLTGVADGFATFNSHKALGATLMVGGLAGIWWAVTARKRRSL